MTMNRTTPPFTFSGRVRSMQYAFTGIRDLLATQHNAWIHAIATMLVFCAAWILDVAAIQWCVLILAVSAVWVAEGLNTAFELICDVVCPEFHPLVKRAKDIAAGAVLLSALGAWRCRGGIGDFSAACRPAPVTLDVAQPDDRGISTRARPDGSSTAPL